MQIQQFGGGDDRYYREQALPGDAQTLAGALAWISANAARWGAYTLTVKAGETIPAQRLFYDGKRVRITLRGGAAGGEVRLGGRGALFTVEQGVTLQVENLTLRGRGNSRSAANDQPLVLVRSGGLLKLQAGAVITEHYTSGGGGGVRVGAHAACVMAGGAICGNTAATYGGGIAVEENAACAMEGGEIYGNTVINGCGGGAHVSGGAFTLEGGTIRGNRAGGGGGVHVSHNGIFTMRKGRICGNTAADGGGVRVGSGTFIMEGGEIRGNTSAERGGGGVRFYEGTFIKKGGTVYGDAGTAHTPDSGGWAYADGSGGGAWILRGTGRTGVRKAE